LQRLSLGRVTLRSYRATAAIQLQPNSKVRVSRSLLLLLPLSLMSPSADSVVESIAAQVSHH
jgi:hypothetical protein